MADLLLIYKAIKPAYCSKCGLELPLEYTQVEPDTKRVHELLTLNVKCRFCNSFTEVKTRNVYNEIYTPPTPPAVESISIWDFNEIAGVNVPDSSVNPKKFGNGTIHDDTFTQWMPVYLGDTVLITFGLFPGEQYFPWIDFPQLPSVVNWTGFTMCGWLTAFSVPADDMYCIWDMAFTGSTEILVAAGTDALDDLTIRVHIGAKQLEVTIPVAELFDDFGLVFWTITVDALGNAVLKTKTKDINPTHTDTEVGVSLPDNVKYYLRAWEQRPESTHAYLPGGGVLGRHKIYNGALEQVDLDTIYTNEYEYYYSITPPLPDPQGLWEINQGVGILIPNDSIVIPRFNDGDVIAGGGVFNWTQVSPPALLRNVLDISGGAYIDLNGTTVDFNFLLGFTITGWVAVKKAAWVPDQVILSISSPGNNLEIYPSLFWVDPPGEWRYSIAVFDGFSEINLLEHPVTDDFIFYAYSWEPIGLGMGIFYVYTGIGVSNSALSIIAPIAPMTNHDMYIGAPTPNSLLLAPLDGRLGKHAFYVNGALTPPQIDQIVVDEAGDYWI